MSFYRTYRRLADRRAEWATQLRALDNSVTLELATLRGLPDVDEIKLYRKRLARLQRDLRTASQHLLELPE